jgi:hypothetical protein
MALHVTPTLRRKLNRREIGLLTLLGVTLVALAVWPLLRPPGAARRSPVQAGSQERYEPIPRIGLARLAEPRPAATAGRRNLFDFGAPPVAEEPVVAPTPPAIPAGPARSADATGASGEGPPAPTLPPLNVRYIGSVENAAGVKVAVLVTDRQEVLTGQPGQVVANRYRIARIGLESVDLEDVATGQSRRIPLRGS